MRPGPTALPPRSRARVDGSAAAALAVALLVLGACAGGEPPVRSLVMVSIDTLRADHLGTYGYPRPTSPFLDRLAAEGVVFERALAATSTTAPSHATMLTGLYPIQHGLRANGQQLPEDARLLPELLAEAGWDTAGFVSTSGHFGASGLAAGFARFDEPAAMEQTGLVERPAEATIAAAARFLEQRTAPEPLFLWIHLFDPHSPYRPETPLAQPRRERAQLASFLLGRHRLDPAFFRGDETLMVELVSAYDGEIQAADRALRTLFRTLDETWGRRGSVWIVTADHGEGLGNHGWLLHGSRIYNEQLHVPLVFHAPERFAPRRVEGIAEHVDLLPTVLELASLPVPERLPGVSLLPVLRGAALPAGRFALAQRRSFEPRSERPPPPPLPERPGVDDLLLAATQGNYESGERFAIQDDRHKLIWHSEQGAELYDLASDPYETRDLAAEQPERVRALRERLERRLEALRADALRGPVLPVDPEARRALEALGYVDP